MTDYGLRLAKPGVREFFDIVIRIEALVLRPTSQRPEDILDLAEALAHAARAAQEPDGCECGPNTMCMEHAMARGGDQ